MLMPFSPLACLLGCVLLLTACGAEQESAGDQDARTVEILRSSGLPAPTSGLTDSLQMLGESMYARGEIDSARAVFSLVLTRLTGDSSSSARALTWLAQAAWRLGEYGTTRRLGEEALGIKLRHGYDDDLFRSYNILGLLAWNESRPLDAIELLEKATTAAEAAGDSANLAKAWNNLGLVATSLGNYDEAGYWRVFVKRGKRNEMLLVSYT